MSANSADKSRRVDSHLLPVLLLGGESLLFGLPTELASRQALCMRLRVWRLEAPIVLLYIQLPTCRMSAAGITDCTT